MGGIDFRLALDGCLDANAGRSLSGNTLRCSQLNPIVYQAGLHAIRILSRFHPASDALTALSRIWLRHAKVRTLLAEQQFDGVIDGGANVGEFAQIARLALPNADIVCVEPNPGCAASLRKQGFRVVEAALWKEPARLTLTLPTTASTSGTVMGQGIGTGPESERSWNVDAVRLDCLAISGTRLLVKLDLQGAELAALEGMGVLWERCAGVLLEVSIGVGGTYEPLREMLSGRGFYEYSTTNELDVAGRVAEADKLWLRL